MRVMTGVSVWVIIVASVCDETTGTSTRSENSAALFREMSAVCVALTQVNNKQEIIELTTTL